jgi:hypothetical protein
VNAAESVAYRAWLVDALADARRFRWLCDGNGYFLEEQAIAGSLNELERARAAIDAEMTNIDAMVKPIHPVELP